MRKYEDIHYKNNYLTNVVCRLDFPSILEISTHVPDKLQNEIKEIFPYFEHKLIVKYSTIFDKDEKIDRRQEMPSYQFLNNERDKSVNLTQDYLTVEFFKYNNFKEFKNVVNKIISSFTIIYMPTNFKRLGLRYVNQIILEKGNPLIWKDYINNSLIHVIDNFLNRDNHISRSMSQIILTYDDYKINFSYGIFNSEFPSRVSRKEFILDFDCYTDFVDDENILGQIDLFNMEIKELFEKSIKNGLRNKMEMLNE